MLLQGSIDDDTKKLLEAVEVMIHNLYRQNQDLEPPEARKPVREIMAVLASSYFSVLDLCKQERTFRAPVYAIIRSLIEGTISALAFCKDREDRSKMYEGFAAVLDWKFAVLDSKHVGSPFVPDTDGQRKILNQRRCKTEAALRDRYGVGFFSGNSHDKEALHKAIDEQRLRKFRDKWYPEERKQLLKDAGYEWIYEVLYTRLSCCVHSDTAATRMFPRPSRNSVIMLATMLLEIGILAL